MSTVADCLSGKCDCPSASACKFARCKNCDYPIDAHGKTLVDHGCQEELLQVCPDCGGPLNDRLVYGALESAGEPTQAGLPPIDTSLHTPELVASLQKRALDPQEPTQAAAGGEDDEAYLLASDALSEGKLGSLAEIHIARLMGVVDRQRAALSRARDEGRAEGMRDLDDLRKHWGAFCDADPFDGSDTFAERMERAGYVRLRPVRKADLQSSFAAERGIEPGGMLWELTAKGRAALNPPASEGAQGTEKE